MNVDARRRVIRLRVLAVRAARRIGGLSAVRTLAATLETFDTAGGGLVAGGLAYATLVAILPGLLLVVTVVGFVVNDIAVREQLVESIARAVPPLEELARLALDQVAGGAVPTSILALIGLIWGSSRFYAALDSAFARVFRNAPRRGALRQTARGIVLTGLFAAVPVGALTLGALLERSKTTIDGVAIGVGPPGQDQALTPGPE